MLEPVKENWRVLLLIVVVVAASLALFAPQFAPDTAPGEDDTEVQQGLTNLQYGLDLAGGTRVRAPLIGYTATGVQFDGDNSQTSQGPSRMSWTMSPPATSTPINNADERAVEVTDPSVSEDRFRAAMDASGYEYSGIRAGVTQETRDAAQSVIQGRSTRRGSPAGASSRCSRSRASTSCSSRCRARTEAT